MAKRLTDLTIDSLIVDGRGQPLSSASRGAVDIFHQVKLDTWYNCYIDILEIHATVSRGQAVAEYGGAGCSCNTPTLWIATGIVIIAGIPATLVHPLRFFQAAGSLQLTVTQIKYQRQPQKIKTLQVSISNLVSVV